MSSTSPRQGLSKTLRSIKARFIVGLSLVLLAAVFSASALTANLNGPLGQTAGSFAANVFSAFGGGDSVQPQVSSTPPDAADVPFDPKGSDVVFEVESPELACAPVSGTIAAGDPTTAVRLFRDGNQSTCGGKAFPGTFGAGAFRYDVHNYVNNSGSTCITATVTVPSTDIHAIAYVGGFNPANLATNYVGDVGSSITQPFSFNVPLGATYQIVILENFANPGPFPYTIDTDSCGATTCAAPPANMVAWYPGEINTNDIIGDPVNNGTFQGSGAYTTGVVGNAFNFTGSNNVQVPTSAGINVGAADGISVDAWIRPTTLTQQAIVEWERSNGSGLIGAHFYQSVGTAGNLYVNLSDTTGANHIFQTTTGVLTAGANQHVAFTYNKADGAVAIYLNGVAQTLTSSNVGTGFTPGTGGSMFIGRRTTGVDFFVGVMDEVEIFSRAMSGAEVASIFAAGANGKCHVSQIKFDVAAQSVPENGGSAVTTIKRVGANDTTATVAYNVADGTATGGGVDFGNASTSIVTFSPGERTQTVSIPIIDDAIDEVDETFTASISLPTGGGVSLAPPTTQTITITDNDAVPNITINDSLLGIEGNPGPAGSATFTVTKTGATTLDSSVVVTPTNGIGIGGAACTAGVDFINTPTTLNFPASLTTDTQTVTVTFCADAEVEVDQTFTMVLTPTGATAGVAGNGLIRDDDSSVQFTAATFMNAEGTIAGPGLTPFNLTVSRTAGAGASGLPAATVDASTIQVGGTAVGNNSCAIAGTDYVVVSGQTLSWAANDVANKTLVVNVCADSTDENNETFNSQLSNANNTVIGAPASAVTTITDDDAAPTYALACTPTTIAEGASTTCTVTRTGATEIAPVTVAWSTALVSAEATDFSPATGSVSFAAADTSRTFTVTAAVDALFEPAEVFNVNLAATASDGGTTSGSPQAITISASGTAPTVAINDVTQVELNSGSSAFIFTITRTGDAEANQTMVASTANGGGANVPATFPSDYTQIIGDTVTFTQGQTSRQVAVIVNGDTTFEDNENFTVNLASFNFGSATDGTGLGTITNDDLAPVFTIGANVAVSEGNSGTVNATFTINKVGATELNSIVSASSADGPAANATGGPEPCAFPCDYVSIVNAQVATFAPSDLSKTFNVRINPDTIFEVDENFTVTLTNVTNGTFGTPISAQGTITNNDIAPVFTVTGTQLSPTEGSAATFSVVRSFTAPTTGTDVSATVTCTPSVTGTASSGDFGSAGTAVFAPATASPQTCSVGTIQDAVFEGPETFTVTATVGAGTGTVTGGPFNPVTIVNDDACSFAATNVSQFELNASTSNFVHSVTKTCNTGTFNALVSYASSDGTAINPVDYTEIIPGTLAFLPATTSLTLPVSVNGDLLVEADETYNVLLTGATVNGVAVPNGACGVAVCGLTNGLGTILNDDGMPISISGTITNFGGGAAAGVTVTLSGTSGGVTVTNASGGYTFTGLASGGNFLVTPTAPAGTVASPTTRSYTGITASVTNANFVLYQVGAIPRTLNVVNSYTVPGSPVTVPIMLTAQGDEAALSGTLTYAAPLSAPSVACGSGSAMCSLTSNTGTPGVVTFTVEAQDAGGNPTVYAAGNRVVILVTFNTSATAAQNAPVNFANAPTVLRTSDPGSNPLPTVYNNGFVVFQQGLESDVAGRTAGNGTLNAGDVIQVRRFVATLDTADASTNEYQRADAAPAGTKGNGALDAGDVIQARRYAANLDPQQTAGGPFGPVARPGTAERGTKGFDSDAPASVNTILRTTTVSGNQGTQVFVDGELDSVVADSVHAFGTSIQFDTTRVTLTAADVTLGSATNGTSGPTCSLTTNPSQLGSGRMGILIDCPIAPPNPIPAGTNRQAFRMRFTILPNAPQGLTPVALVTMPIPQSMSNELGNDVTFTNQNGGINVILNPTAAGVTVGGRVTTDTGAGLRGATVSITDAEGNRRTVTTSTFGYYQFEDVEAGASYVVAVSSRRFRFSPRVVQVVDNLSDVDFVGVQ